MPSDSPQYFIDRTTKTVANLGLKKVRFRRHWKALPLDLSRKKSKAGLPQFIKDAGTAFEIDYSTLSRQTMQIMDALVALWCCNMWGSSAEHTPRIDEGRERGEPDTAA